jgi:hypothetical protein
VRSAAPIAASASAANPVLAQYKALVVLVVVTLSFVEVIVRSSVFLSRSYGTAPLRDSFYTEGDGAS